MRDKIIPDKLVEGVNIMTSVMSCSDWDTLRHPASDVIQTQQHGRHAVTTRCQWDIQLGVISIAVVINVVFADYLTQWEELGSLLCSHKRHQYQWHWSTRQHHPDRLLNLTRGTFSFASSARLLCHSFCLCGLKGSLWSASAVTLDLFHSGRTAVLSFPDWQSERKSMGTSSLPQKICDAAETMIIW